MKELPQPFPQAPWEKDFQETERHLFPVMSEFADKFQALPKPTRTYLTLCYQYSSPNITPKEKIDVNAKMLTTLDEMQKDPVEWQAYLDFIKWESQYEAKKREKAGDVHAIRGRKP